MQANDFAALLGPEPAWVECKGCGELTAKSPCWDCHQKHLDGRVSRENEQACRMPARFAWAKLDAPELKERVKSSQYPDYLASKILASKTTLVAGVTGTGKTSLAVACMRRRVPRCLYVTAAELSAFGAAKDQLAERASSTPFLLLDDLGRDVDSATNAVPMVLGARHDADLATVITTGLTRSQLESRYDAGIIRRIVVEATRIVLGEST